MIHPIVFIYIYIQGGPKVDKQYTGNYCIPTFGPPCIRTHQ